MWKCFNHLHHFWANKRQKKKMHSYVCCNKFCMWSTEYFVNCDGHQSISLVCWTSTVTGESGLCPSVGMCHGYDLHSRKATRVSVCGSSMSHDIDGLVQDCSNSSALAMELLQSCTQPSIFACRNEKNTISLWVVIPINQSPYLLDIYSDRRKWVLSQCGNVS